MAIPAIVDPVFQPAMRIIQAITKANPAVVTTTFDNDYITGTIVRLDIPPIFGMPEANQKLGSIRVLTPTTFEITIDTTFFQAFAYPMVLPSRYTTLPQVVPVGELNGQLTAATQNVL